MTALELFTERRRVKVVEGEGKLPNFERTEEKEIVNNRSHLDSFSFQVNRLQSLIDNLSSSRVKIHPREEVIVNSSDDQDNRAFTTVSRFFFFFISFLFIFIYLFLFFFYFHLLLFLFTFILFSFSFKQRTQSQTRKLRRL